MKMAKIMKISHESAIGGKVNPQLSPSINISIGFTLLGVLFKNKLSLFIITNHHNFKG